VTDPNAIAPGAVEFWPDYPSALLHVAGRQIAFADLPIPSDLARRAAAWVGEYDDTKLPFGDHPDAEWMTEGRAIFAAIHDALATHGVTLVDWEGIWASPPDAIPDTI
jgi:hypothetical protein